MKRSKSISLKLMVAGGSALALAACSEDVDEVEAFRTVDQCVAQGESQAACEEAFSEALKIHQESGPRYESRNLCEEEFGIGDCSQVQSGGNSFWMPLLTGFIVGRALDNVGGFASGTSRPIYRYRDRSLRTDLGAPLRRLDSGRIGVSRDAITTSPRPARVMTRTTVASRGGFGGGRSGGFGG